jgi:HEAT repeat protein
MSRARNLLVLACLAASALTLPARADVLVTVSSERRSDAYREGQRALDNQAWDDASRIFGKIASGSGDEVDAALYWKAYADWKRKQKKDAVEGLRKLLSSYPKSAWADDAKALELEIRDGQPAKDASPSDDEELKLYALDGLMQIEPEKAVPILERLLAGNSSPRIKERALFVLSQSDSPRAREILLRVAKTGQPPELRREAVKTLGISGEKEDLRALEELAKDKDAPEYVRAAIVEAYLIAGASDQLLTIAKSDPDPRIRAKAIEALGATDSTSSLRQLWATERDPAIRAKLLESFGVAGDVEPLAKAARDEDPRIRRKAIEGLAIIDSPAASRALHQLYTELKDPDDRRKVVEAFMIQGDAKTLLEMFRAEKDPAMKKIIFQQLTVMDDPEATKVILEVLGEKP